MNPTTPNKPIPPIDPTTPSPSHPSLTSSRPSPSTPTKSRTPTLTYTELELACENLSIGWDVQKKQILELKERNARLRGLLGRKGRGRGRKGVRFRSGRKKKGEREGVVNDDAWVDVEGSQDRPEATTTTTTARLLAENARLHHLLLQTIKFRKRFIPIQNARHTRLIPALKAKLTHLTHHTTDLQAEVAHLQTSHADLLAQTTALQQQLQTLWTEGTALQQHATHLTHENETLHSTISDLNNDLAFATSYAQQAQSCVERLAAVNGELEIALEGRICKLTSGQPGWLMRQLDLQEREMGGRVEEVGASSSSGSGVLGRRGGGRGAAARMDRGRRDLAVIEGPDDEVCDSRFRSLIASLSRVLHRRRLRQEQAHINMMGAVWVAVFWMLFSVFLLVVLR
ncbi:hypothetical protein M409DRAFT_24301 [Zasmidium cellare ATCC 36951]|uniref:Uncharacterized protein n=1 Tax=Zasmidium cellare ATCC 36951 TaxID=1080233 RepID=A0A6A6CHM9_ZASCE|nr:uncharacterized protein M409DRAFT_24301 [Zasmidium cellare ATCC 36951]KAF2165452.1 hypothetical protein M409DRAFT_24301 [Zasmidium cellare ATCC 36951]